VIRRHIAKPMVLVILAVLLAAVTPAVEAQEAILRGKLGYELAYGYTADELVENGLVLELDVERRLGSAGKVHVGFSGRLGAAAEPSVKLDEAYADVYLADVDLRLGRQVINWGTADGFNPTNVLNPRGPLSAAALLAAGGMPGGTPVVAIQASYYLPSGASVTGVGIAGFVPAAGVDELLEAVAVRIGAELPGGAPLPVKGPAAVPSDGSQFEWAARVEGLLADHNVYVSYFRGWDDYPAAWVEGRLIPGGSDFLFLPPQVVAAYRKVHKLGLATAGTVGDAGVWSEVAYTIPDELPGLDAPGVLALSSNDGYLEAVAGADYTFGNGVFVSGQVIYNGGGSLLQPYKKPGAAVEPQTYVAGMVRYSPQPGHELQGVVLVNAVDRGVLAMARYTYELTQSVSLTVGVSRVFAGAESEFAAIEPQANLAAAGITVSF